MTFLFNLSSISFFKGLPLSQVELPPLMQLDSLDNAPGVPIGTPGALSKESNCIKGGNSTWLNGRPLKNDIELRLNRKVILENDANCFALSEAYDGAGSKHEIVFGVILGTGVGGGLVINKKAVSYTHLTLPTR